MMMCDNHGFVPIKPLYVNDEKYSLTMIGIVFFFNFYLD